VVVGVEGREKWEGEGRERGRGEGGEKGGKEERSGK